MPNTTLIETGKINFIRTGLKGRTAVVLLHPMGMDLTLWEHQINVLRAQFDVIVPDLPGHGLSAKLEGEHSFGHLAAVLIAFVEELGVGAVHLAGISYGGMIAQEIALKKPGLIRSLSLIATASTFTAPVRQILNDRAAFVRMNGISSLAPLSLARWFTPEFTEKRPEVIDRVAKLLLQQDAENHALIWDIVASLDTEARLKELSVPAMIVVGDQDASTPIASAEIMAAALKTENLQIVRNVSHFPILEEPEIVSTLLLNFYLSLEPV